MFWKAVCPVISGLLFYPHWPLFNQMSHLQHAYTPRQKLCELPQTHCLTQCQPDRVQVHRSLHTFLDHKSTLAYTSFCLKHPEGRDRIKFNTVFIIKLDGSLIVIEENHSRFNPKYKKQKTEYNAMSSRASDIISGWLITFDTSRDVPANVFLPLQLVSLFTHHGKSAKTSEEPPQRSCTFTGLVYSFRRIDKSLKAHRWSGQIVQKLQ